MPMIFNRQYYTQFLFNIHTIVSLSPKAKKLWGCEEWDFLTGLMPFMTPTNIANVLKEIK